MDKRKVIAAYRRGFITIQECAQIIGVDSRQAARLVNDVKLTHDLSMLREQATVKSL
ncbi:hypothetical protein [Paenibacillus soyae]|uniref:Uncharacterized protein n=1 Tax=Paenibacillus soyae TaxID=2969249 RepID=A0A9X2MMD0_9BACL|nr:hypothetical protein [Paenibacillus soyae]MCR2803010.1 hypothetical protein [Paenibacillus soyae]